MCILYIFTYIIYWLSFKAERWVHNPFLLVNCIFSEGLNKQGSLVRSLTSGLPEDLGKENVNSYQYQQFDID